MNTQADIIWKTPGGKLTTNQVVKAEFTLPEFHENKLIQWELHVAPDLGSYDMIIGRDLLKFLQIDILFSKETVSWDNMDIPFKNTDTTVQEAYHIQDSKLISSSTEKIKKILDAKYEKANLKTIIQAQEHLSLIQQDKLRSLLHKYKTLFDGTLGT